LGIKGLGIEGIDLHYAALIACIFNEKLSGDKAMRKMGILDENKSKKMINDDFEIKKCEKDNIERLYHIEGLTMVQIGDIYSTGRVVIDRFMLRNGIKTKSRGRKLGSKNIKKKVGAKI